MSARRYAMIILALLLIGCEGSQQQFQNWQEKYLQKRYGLDKSAPDKIPAWQKEAAEYESVVQQKIEAGAKAAAVYHRLGESFAASENYQLCVDSLQKSLIYGADNMDVLYSLATCQGNLARQNNWPYEQSKAAEETLLKILQKDNNSSRARFQLALVYFYGFGSHSQYRVMADLFTASEKEYRAQAIHLLEEAIQLDPAHSRSYFALASMYQQTGNAAGARQQMENLRELIRKNKPSAYQNDPEFQQAEKNLESLIGVK